MPGLSFSPEVVLAVEAKARSVGADPAADMWAVGAIAFELLTRTRAFSSRATMATVRDQIAGRAPLTWEDPAQRGSKLRQLRILKRIVLACLSRDPRQRPSANKLLNSWKRLFDAMTTCSGLFGSTTPLHNNGGGTCGVAGAQSVGQASARMQASGVL
jgi:serine/threonine protein kinase